MQKTGGEKKREKKKKRRKKKKKRGSGRQTGDSDNGLDDSSLLALRLLDGEGVDEVGEGDGNRDGREVGAVVSERGVADDRRQQRDGRADDPEEQQRLVRRGVVRLAVKSQTSNVKRQNRVGQNLAESCSAECGQPC
eukprot:1951538-Rhodomonas_salina.1